MPLISDIDYSGLPHDVHNEMRRYVEGGILPRSFLTAVLQNNLLDALMFRGGYTAEEMFSIARFVYRELPLACHGSPEKFAAWLQHYDAIRSEVAL